MMKEGEEMKTTVRAKCLLALAFTQAVACSTMAAIVTNVKAQQRPDADIVDIYYDR